jgi:hypothetical protein
MANQRDCEACGKRFKPKTGNINRGYGRTCSKACAIAVRQQRAKAPGQAAERFWNFVDKDGPIPKHVPHLGPCWLWTGAIRERGYGAFNLSGKAERAHRVSFLFAFGEPNGLVLHRCDNRACVRPSHLFTGSNKENTEDARWKGRLARGERHGNCKLTDAQVEVIRRDSRPGPVVAAEFGVTPGHVRVLRDFRLRRLLTG